MLPSPKALPQPLPRHFPRHRPAPLLPLDPRLLLLSPKAPSISPDAPRSPAGLALLRVLSAFLRANGGAARSREIGRFLRSSAVPVDVTEQPPPPGTLPGDAAPPPAAAAAAGVSSTGDDALQLLKRTFGSLTAFAQAYPQTLVFCIHGTQHTICKSPQHTQHGRVWQSQLIFRETVCLQEALFCMPLCFSFSFHR